MRTEKLSLIAAVAAASLKLDEAKFFLRLLSKVETEFMMEDTVRRFDWYLSAFQSASRSTFQIIFGSKGHEQASNLMKAWGTDDYDFCQTFKESRDVTVHEGGGGADSTIEMVTEWELPFRSRDPLRGYVNIISHSGIPLPRFGIHRFTLHTAELDLPAVECCVKYLGLARRLVDELR